MKFTVKSLKYGFFIIAFSLFVFYFKIKLKNTMGIEDVSFGDVDFLYSMAIDLGIYYSTKILYYIVDFKAML